MPHSQPHLHTSTSVRSLLGPSLESSSGSSSGACAKVGVMCINIGTPSSPQTKSVRVYLREFLRDPRIIDVWLPRLLVGTIVPYVRAVFSAKKYASIWHKDRGSPLLYHGEDLSQDLQKRLNVAPGEYQVCLAMKYGEPKISQVLDRLMVRGVESIVVIPLFPQYASSSFGSVLDALYRHGAKKPVVPNFRVVPAFYQDADFVRIQAEALTSYLKNLEDTASSRSRSCLRHRRHVLMSYHGVPLRQCQRTLGDMACSDSEAMDCGEDDYRCCAKATLRNANCYRHQCVVTSRLLAASAGLGDEEYSVGFQSRLGVDRWTEPNSLDVLQELGLRGDIQKVIVITPSFLHDCLETLEEIGSEAKHSIEKRFPHMSVELVPCLNSSPALVEYFCNKVLLLSKDLCKTP